MHPERFEIWSRANLAPNVADGLGLPTRSDTPHKGIRTSKAAAGCGRNKWNLDMYSEEISEKPNFAFGVASPHDMLTKLRNELGRIANSSFSKNDLVEHGTNCALTAWSIADWVWRSRFADDHKALETLLEKHEDLASPPKKKRKDRFNEYITRECPALALCQDIANGFKHVVPHAPAARQAVGVADTTASASVAPPGPFILGSSTLGSEGLGGPGYVAGAEMYRLKIMTTDGGKRDAIRVFDEAIAFWTRFMSEHL